MRPMPNAALSCRAEAADGRSLRYVDEGDKGLRRGLLQRDVRLRKYRRRLALCRIFTLPLLEIPIGPRV